MLIMRKIIAISVFFLWGSFIGAQQRPISIAEAVYYAAHDETAPRGYRPLYPEGYRKLQWVKGTQQYLYSNEEGTHLFNLKGEKVLTLNKEVSTQFPTLEYIDKNEVVLSNATAFKRYDYVNEKSLGEISLPKEAENKEYNPLSHTIAYTLQNNLYIADAQTATRAVTQFADPNIVAGKSIHRNEFGIQKGTFFSPKGKYLAFYQKDETKVANYPLVDITTTPATLKNIKYPMAGQPSEQAAVGVYDLASQKLIYLDINTQDEHFLTNLSWSPDEQYILLAEVNRAQNHFALNCYEVATGKKVRTLFEEENPKWVEPETPALFLPNRNNEFLWLSERDGFMNVYHYDLSGKLIQQLTHSKWVVQEIAGFDTQGKNVFLVGTGEDPREKHCFKISLKNPKKLIRLTTVAGTHNVQLSSDGQWLLDTYSSLTIPKNIELISTEKGSSKRLLTTENPLQGFAVGTTELLTLKASDGTPLYAKMHKPTNFDPTKKYPVLIYVYGGPHAQLVTNSWGANSYLWMPVFAENEQYIVFSLDNRGSAYRGFDFESVIHRRLGDIEIEDQMKGVSYLKSLPYVDANRIAVHGWSFGGFMASSLLTRHPEVFSTAVAGGAVTDWKYYEVMYGERYMDTPKENPEGYEKSRVGKYLGNLQRPLLFIHGSVDDVVVPQHLMSLTKESVTKNDFIEMFFYPMHGHGVRGADNVNLTERILDFVKKHNQ